MFVGSKTLVHSDNLVSDRGFNRLVKQHKAIHYIRKKPERGRPKDFSFVCI